MDTASKKAAIRHGAAYLTALIARIVGFGVAAALLGWDADPPMIAGCWQCFYSFLVVAVLVLPPALIGEWQWIHLRKWRWWIHVPVMTVLYCVIGCLVWVVPSWLGSGHVPDAGFLAAALYDIVLPGMVYWFTLRLMALWLDAPRPLR